MPPEAGKSLAAMEDEQSGEGAEQRHETEFLREFRVKINLALRRLEVLTIPAAVATAGQPANTDEEDEVPPPGPSPHKRLEAFQPGAAEDLFRRYKLVSEPGTRLHPTTFLPP